MVEKEKLSEADAAVESDVSEIKETKYDDSTNISPEMNIAEANAVEAERGGGRRDITVSSLVHLLGIPNKDELKILDKKIDLVLNRLNSLAVKVDAIASDLSSGGLSSALVRIEEQLLTVRHKVDSGK